MLHTALKQIGKGRQTNVGMLFDVHPVTWRIVGVQDVIEKNERSDTSAFGRG